MAVKGQVGFEVEGGPEMTNVEIRMTKEERSTKHEGPKPFRA